MGPQRRISTTKDYTFADLYAIREIDFMSGRYDASVDQQESRIYFVYYIRIRNRVDLIHPDDLRVPTEKNFIAASNHIQMPYTCVVSNGQLAYTGNNVEVTKGDVILDRAGPRINDAHTNLDALANSISKEQSIKWALNERR